MARDTEEHERPVEWLRALREGRKTYAWLVDDSGGLAPAAYRLARARGRTGEVSNSIPTLSELFSAFGDVARASGARAKHLSRAMLIEECEARGLPVIAPLTRRAA